MQIVHIPKAPKSLVFDIDLTLYDNRDYHRSQANLLIERLATHLGTSTTEAESEVRRVREAFAYANHGRKLSMGNVFLQLGISIATSAMWREELYHPEAYLEPDDALRTALSELSRSFLIAAVTNNPTSIGERTLAALGVGAYFTPVIGLDIAGESKPTMVPFRMVAEQHHVSLEEMVSIGDRMAVDVEVPVQNGMGGILIERVADVYQLPEILKNGYREIDLPPKTIYDEK